MNKELQKQFLDLACSLSPENLSCDGELSRVATNRKYRQLSKEWRALEVLVGRKVSEEEAYGLDKQIS